MTRSSARRSVWIASGGSGGHLFPAQSLARRLLTRGLDVRLVGANLSQSPFLDREAFAFSDIESPRPGWRPRKFVAFARGLGRGVRQALALLRADRPCGIIGFGSYHSVAPLAAGAWLKIPLLLHEANAKLGRVSWLFSPLARSIAVQFRRLIPDGGAGKFALTRMPLNERWASSPVPPRAEALRYFGLMDQKATLLVVGGSQGARFLNEIAPAALERKRAHFQEWQVLHLAGERADLISLAARYRQAGISACVRSFERQMHWAWSIANFAICRAGGSTLAELRHFGVPALLIPLTGAHGHQKSNAHLYIEETAGAVWMSQRAAHPRALAERLMEIVCPTAQNLSAMRAALSARAPNIPPMEIDEWTIKSLDIAL